jgi:uncharacterized repeat protein (TIGR01451 family)
MATVLTALSVAILPAQIASAATQNVSNCNDSGAGSLRAALGLAGDGDTITFSVNCPAATPITLASTLDITSSVTITGPGAADMVIDGNNAVQDFAVSVGKTVSISGITVENGNTEAGCPSGCSSSGGGIENDGNLTLTSVVVSGNTAGSGCFEFCGASGGGIENNGTLAVIGGSITGNTAVGECEFACSGQGGGIENNGTLTVTGSTITGNTANGPATGCVVSCGASGGGIENTLGSTATITGTVISGNNAELGCTEACGASGGAIDNAGTLSVTDSVINNNSAGAFCDLDCAPLGGGIANESTGTLNLTNTTLSANSTSTGCTFGCNLMGGGLYNDGTVNIQGSTIVGSAAVGHDCFLDAPLNDLGGNRDDDGTCVFIAQDGSEVRAVIQVSTSPSFAGDAVHIDSSQLQAACGGFITFETLQGGSTKAPRASSNNITVVLDDDGNVTVVVNGADCKPGTDTVEADLTVAPFLTALTTLVVSPPVVTAEGVTANPANEVETGDTSASGDSDVYTVFTVETSPVYAEQPVEISSPQLQSRCIEGWRWEPGSGTAINQTSGTTIASGILDDDGNATFVFKGRSCATGPSQVIADVLAGTHPTYVTTFTVSPPVATFAGAMQATANKNGKKAKAHTHPKKGKKGKKGGSGSGSSGSGGATGTGTNPNGISVIASPNADIETGLPLPSQTPNLNITKTDDSGGSSVTDSVGYVAAGSNVEYTVTVSNTGTGEADGVNVSDIFSTNPNIDSDSYTATATGNASGFTALGSGDINDTVDLPAGSSITYVIDASVPCETYGDTLSNTASDTYLGSTQSATDTDYLGFEYCDY